MHFVKRLCRIAAVLLLSAAPFPSMAQSNNPSDNKARFVMKIAGATVNDVGQEWMKLYAAAIEAKSGGRIKTELYPGSQLGPIPREIEDTQLGSIQVAQFPPEFFSGVDQRFGLLAAPGLFETEQHALRTVSAPEFRKAFLAVGEAKGLIGATLFFAGQAAFAMRTPFHDLASLKGKKIRVLASPFQMRQVASLGATAVPMTLSDVLPALQQGTVDGAIGSLPTFTALGYYDAAKYINEPGTSYIFVMAVVSKRWFDALPADLQAMVLTTAQEAATEVQRVERRFRHASAQDLGRKGRRDRRTITRRQGENDAGNWHHRRRHRQDQTGITTALETAACRGNAQSLTPSCSATGAIVLRGLVAGIQGVTALMILIAVALDVANIVGRYVFFRPIASAEEFMLFLLVGTVFLGNAIVGFEGRQLRMDVILHALPPALRRALDIAADLTMIAVCVTLIVLAWPAVQMLAEFDERSEAANFPLVIPQALVPIGLGLNAFLVGIRLIRSFRAPRRC